MVILAKIFITAFLLTLSAFAVGQNLDTSSRPTRTRAFGFKLWRCAGALMFAEFVAFILAVTWKAPF